MSWNSLTQLQKQQRIAQAKIALAKKELKISGLLAKLNQCDSREQNLTRITRSTGGCAPFGKAQSNACVALHKQIPQCTLLENEILALGGKLPARRAAERFKEPAWLKELQRLPMVGGDEKTSSGLLSKTTGALTKFNDWSKSYRKPAAQIFNNIPMVKETGVDVTNYMGAGSDFLLKNLQPVTGQYERKLRHRI